MPIARLKRLGFAAALFLALAPAPAFAQTAPSPTHVAEAKTLIVAADLVRPFEAVLLGIADKLKSSVGPTRPEVLNDYEIVVGEMKPYFDELLAEIEKMAVVAVTTRFTEAELKEINAFFKTPVGVKYAQALPEAIDDFTGKFVAWGETKEREIITKIREALAKRGHKL